MVWVDQEMHDGILVRGTLAGDFCAFTTTESPPKICIIQINPLNLHRKTSPGGGMVDALVSGASAARRAGSSPVLGTD